MSKTVNPKWYKDKLEYFQAHGNLDITVDYNKAAQAIIVFLSSKNIPFRVYSLGAGVKRITTETKNCPCCKRSFN